MKPLLIHAAALAAFILSTAHARAQDDAPPAPARPPQLSPLGAPESDPSPTPAADAPPVYDHSLRAQPLLGTKQSFLKFSAGVRVAFIRDEGLDRFSTTDAVTTATLSVSRTLLTQDRLSLAVGLTYDGGARSGRARGVETNMAHHRFVVPIEGRYHLFPFLYGFARVAPGTQHTRLRVEDSSAPAPLVLRRWSVATDLSLGASVLLGSHARTDRHIARFWITPEVGYALTQSFGMRLAPDERDDPRPTARTDLGSLAMSGAFMRVSADLTF